MMSRILLCGRPVRSFIAITLTLAVFIRAVAQTLAAPPPQSIPVPPPMHAPWPAGNEWNITPGSEKHTTTDKYAIDFNGPGGPNADEGILVLAAADGVVVLATDGKCPNVNYGCEVVIGHAYGYETRYAHLKQVFVVSGTAVKQGTPVGLLGNTGYSSGPHLHFSVYYCEGDYSSKPGRPCSGLLHSAVPILWDANSQSLTQVDTSKKKFTSGNYGVGYEKIADVKDAKSLVFHQAIQDTYELFGGQYWVFGQTLSPVERWGGTGALTQTFGSRNAPGLAWSGLGSAIVEVGGKAYFILGPIWDKYKVTDGPQGEWGAPVSHTYEWELPLLPDTHAYRSDFEKGSIVWSKGGGYELLNDQNALWVGRFFDRPNTFSGPSVQRRDRYLDFYWPAGTAPGPVLTFDGFSALWETTESGLVNVTRIVAPEVQGHLQVTIEGKVVLTADSPDQVQGFESPLKLGIGDQRIEVKFWQEGGKDARLRLTTAGIIPPVFGSEGTIKSSSSPVPDTPLANYEPPPFPDGSVPPPVPVVSSTASILVFDTSGSMSEPDASGKTKLQAAQAAGGNILDIIAVENQAIGAVSSQVGIVDYNYRAQVDAPLSNDIATARSSLSRLAPNGRTNMPDGLKASIDLLPADTSTLKPIIILLSDGLPNVGYGGDLSMPVPSVKQQVLEQASRAAQRKACIYTVGFGVPQPGGQDSIDEDFLRQVSSASGCGAYYNAQNATQLANTYVELRHVSTGKILLKQSGQIAQGQRVDIGVVPVPTNQSQILFTLNWPGSRLDPILTDPSGNQVNASYPGATLAASASVATIIVKDPRTGDWRVAANGSDVPEGATTYNAIISARPSATVPTAGGPGLGLVIVLLVIGVGGVAIYSRIRRPAQIGGSDRSQHAVSSVASLSCIVGCLPGQLVSVPAAGLLIGRGSGCNLRLPDSGVSRQHARIRYAAGAWFLQDLGSAAGTFVNGQRVQATRLTSGDQIQIGSSVFTFGAKGPSS